jgi:RNA ligase (TIGR02306 family)
MSEFHIIVTKIGKIEKHPNADLLSITNVLGDGTEYSGYPVIFKTTDFSEGDLAVYVPIDAIMPDIEEWKFLGSSRRIKARKLRGVFSMGMLAKAKPEWIEGQNVQEEMLITKYEPSISYQKDYSMGNSDPDEVFLPEYTDIEGYRRYSNVLKECEEVVCTEKTHGSNFRCVYHEGKLYVGSHHRVKKYDEQCLFWKAANKYNLKEKLSKYPDLILYGEVYGNVQKGFDYGCKQGIDLVLFDMRDANTFTFYDYEVFLQIANELNLPTVPLLYRGPWSKDVLKLANGRTTYSGANHIREGFVVRPIKERQERMGRVVLKVIGEEYLLKDK